MSREQEAAICLAFLMDGFNNAHQHKFGHGAKADQYEWHASVHGGYIGIVAAFYPLALDIEGYVETFYSAQDFPGVFHYEVTEGLGAWLFDHPHAVREEFLRHARAVIDDWFAKGLAAHNRAVACMGNSVPVPAPSDTPTLNASQPADAKKGSTTMKINDLIDSLRNIADAHGNVDVVVRGSKETSFVDAKEVRPVKTSKRRVVYIGKVSANQPQE